jgi:hypothetical protein
MLDENKNSSAARKEAEPEQATSKESAVNHGANSNHTGVPATTQKRDMKRFD